MKNKNIIELFLIFITTVSYFMITHQKNNWKLLKCCIFFSKCIFWVFKLQSKNTIFNPALSKSSIYCGVPKYPEQLYIFINKRLYLSTIIIIFVYTSAFWKWVLIIFSYKIIHYSKNKIVAGLVSDIILYVENGKML